MTTINAPAKSFEHAVSYRGALLVAPDPFLLELP